MVGQFALGLAIAAPVVMFTNLQLRGVLATDARNEYRFGDYLALRLCATLLAMLTIGGLVQLAAIVADLAGDLGWSVWRKVSKRSAM